MAKKKRPLHPINYLPIILAIFAISTITLGLLGYKLLPKKLALPRINEITNPTGETTLSFTPNPVNATIGKETTLTLTANAGNSKLTIVTIELTYDPAKITNLIVTLGDFLTNEMSPVKIENGKITFIVAAPPSSGGVTGSGVIATLKFKPTAVGSSTLSFTNKTLSASLALDGSYIDGNTLRSARDVVITAVDVVTPSQSPISTPTSTPIPNPILIVTTTPKPTITPKPRTTNSHTPAPTIEAVNNLTSTSNLLPITEEPKNSSTDQLLTPNEPNFWQKVILGWKIIIQYLFSLFGIK